MKSKIWQRAINQSDSSSSCRYVMSLGPKSQWKKVGNPTPKVWINKLESSSTEIDHFVDVDQRKNQTILGIASLSKRIITFAEREYPILESSSWLRGTSIHYNAESVITQLSLRNSTPVNHLRMYGDIADLRQNLLMISSRIFRQVQVLFFRRWMIIWYRKINWSIIKCNVQFTLESRSPRKPDTPRKKIENLSEYLLSVNAYDHADSARNDSQRNFFEIIFDIHLEENNSIRSYQGYTCSRSDDSTYSTEFTRHNFKMDLNWKSRSL